MLGKLISKREIGANLLTLHFGHSIDYIQHGEYSLCRHLDSLEEC